MSKRKRRRHRHLTKSMLRTLDVHALEIIHDSYMWCAESWSGTRCPLCGITIRPHWLLDTNYSGSGSFILDGGVAWIDGFGGACKKVKNCPGEREWR